VTEARHSPPTDDARPPLRSQAPARAASSPRRIATIAVVLAVALGAWACRAADGAGKAARDAASAAVGIEAAQAGPVAVASPPGSYTATDPATWTDRQLAAQLVFCSVSAADPRAAIRYSEMGVGGVIILGNGARSDIGEDLSAVSHACTTGIEPFIASDEEGGTVQRLRNVIYPLPSARTMGRWSLATTRSKARAYGLRLKELGISVVFGPVADLDVPGHYMSELGRCFSSSPKEVGLHVVAWSSGLTSAGVLPVVKHWPGHGHAANTHVTAAVIPALSVLLTRDMLPFESAFAAGVPMVMVGHLQSRGLTEPHTPASVSPKAMGYLRSRIDTDTIIITDSLSMNATTRALHIGSATAAVRSLVAGADFALVCSASPATLIKAVESAIRSGRLPRSQAETSVRRILRRKALSGLAPAGSGG
jgi:beta-N-acetylhexosaminidase